MNRLRKHKTWSVAGWLLVGFGLAFSVLMILQPWRSCPDDDSAAGCPVTLLDANLTVGALMMMGAGIMLVLGTVFRPLPPRPLLRPLPRPGLGPLPRRPDGR